ncbi:MAG: lysylphosphatidylglycerol synthase transmembrane domain-containing protein [Parcubacteria group bacterium]
MLQKINKKRIFFYIITLAVIVIVYIKIDELNLIADIFKESNYFWLFAILVSQTFFYFFLTLNYQYVLRLKNSHLSIKDLFPMSIVVQFINQVLPSGGLSGQAFFIHYLRRWRIPVFEAIGRAMLEVMTLWMGYGTFVVIGIFLMARRGMFSTHPEALIIVYVFLALAIILVSIFFLTQRKSAGENRITKWLGSRFNNYIGKNKSSDYVGSFFDQFKTSLNIQILKKKGKTFWLAYFWQNMSLLANTFTVFFAARAIGIEISFEVAFISFALARFTASIAAIPGGIGVYETISTLALIGAGLDKGAALGISLITRAFTFWLPIPIGWFIYRWSDKKITESINKGEFGDEHGKTAVTPVNTTPSTS